MPSPNVFSQSQSDPPRKEEPAPPKRTSTFDEEFHRFPEFHRTKREDKGHFTVHNGNQVVYTPPEHPADTKQSSVGKVPLSGRQQQIYRQRWARG